MELGWNSFRRGKSTDDFHQRKRNAGATGALDFYYDEGGADLDEIRSSRNSPSNRFCGRVLEINHKLRSPNACHRGHLFPVHSGHQGCFVLPGDRHCSRTFLVRASCSVSATLDDAVCHPNLQFVVEAVPHPAASDFISTQSGHDSAFFVTAVAATGAALLSDERSLATSRTKITGGCHLMKVPIARDGDLCGL